MTSKIFSQYVASVRSHSDKFSYKSQDLLETLDYFVKASVISSEAIKIVNGKDEKHILLPQNNLKLNCKSRLVLNEHEPFQEVSFHTCDDPELEIIRIFFDIHGQFHINEVPGKDTVGCSLDDGSAGEAIFSIIFQSLFELGIIKATTLRQIE
ncbi:hypothetical protein [Tatumella sp. OPLPL6]|uniref:hypothetical protein n=1 Tax=Tatumella sp. OPLPL6 TaxID=1928657 RepID=UPI000C17F6CD|nr:hypothetical protein [Tatumella sp. OPLPL6]PIJ42823.1 hypothetical protein BOM24_10085 [Tatumella sp. OPLPL6]